MPPDAILQHHKEHAPAATPFANEEIDHALPKVEPTVPISTLQQHINLPKNACFQNIRQHKCNLRSQSPRLIAQHMFNPHYTANRIYKENGAKETIDFLITGKSKDVWLRSLSNDWGRLAQGNVHGVKGTNTIKFISKNDVPSNKKVTCTSFACDFRLLKEEQHRVRIAVGGDKLEHSDDDGSPSANFLETKKYH